KQVVRKSGHLERSLPHLDAAFASGARDIAREQRVWSGAFAKAGGGGPRARGDFAGARGNGQAARIETGGRQRTDRSVDQRGRRAERRTPETHRRAARSF